MTWIIILNFLINIIATTYVAYRLASLFKNRLIILFPFIFIIIFILTRLVGFTQYTWLTNLSIYAFALLICAILVSLVYDSFLLINRYVKWSVSLKAKRIAYLSGVSFLFSWGIYAANSTIITPYAIHINKNANIEKMRIVQVSDIHINELTNPDEIKLLVDNINAQHPDLVVLTGDTLDRHLQPFIDLNLSLVFQEIKSTYGSVLVLGNHEYYGLRRNDTHTLEDVIQAFEKSNLTVLKDQVMPLADTGIMLIGRDDPAANLIGLERKELSELTKNIDMTKTPVILLKHQPHNLNDISEQGIDVVFSGHTHGGQIFPGTIMVKMLYTNPYGLYQQSRETTHDFSSIVSSGYGLWGPPLRLLTQSEIVVTDLTFNKVSSTSQSR